jgi:rhamnose transport system permease protein
MSAPAKTRKFALGHEALLAGLLVALLAAAGWLEPRFIALDTQVSLAADLWEPALVALAMTLIIITAGIDLSVASAVALAAVVMGLAFERGVPPWAAAALAVAVGGALGAINGVFVAYVRVHPLIVTLATYSAYRGVAEGISFGRSISGFPLDIKWLGQGAVAGVPVPALVFAAAAVAAAVFLGRTTVGRAIYAIGHNETACRFSGIAVDRIKLLLYTLSGLAAGAAAVMHVARFDTAKADAGEGMELDVITAVVLGGTSIFGGRGRILGTVLGVLLIHETRKFVSWRWQNSELILIVVGALLILSVLANTLLSRKGRQR